MVEQNVFKTKLCLLYRKGRCPRHNCSFAHGNAELRQSSASFHGNQDHRRGDLRLKLDRRHSPRRKYSPRRDTRGSSPSKYSQKYGDKKRKKEEQFDGQSYYSGSFRSSDGSGDQVKRRKSISTNSRVVLKEQVEIKEAQSDINILEDQKSQLRTLLKEKDDEADVLTSRIQELDAQLFKEKEECTRIASQIKKFVKAHKRHLRAQEELKKSQDRLQRIGDQLSSGTNIDNGNEEDLSINIVSDGIPGSHAINLRNGASNNSFLVEKSVQANHDGAEALTKGTSTLWKTSELDAHSGILKTSKTMNENERHQPVRNEVKQKGTSISGSTSSSDKRKGSGLGVMAPSTSMAAHAIDELVEIEAEENVEVVKTASAERKLPIVLPPPPPLPPPPVLQSSYSEYEEGEDEKVDYEGEEGEMEDVDIL